jgi:ankyrin repeat protein
MKAAQNGHEQVAQVLLEAGAIVSAQDSDGETALMDAAFNGHEQVALVLLEAGASLKVVSIIDNFTMLMAASLGGLTTAVLERVLPQSDIDAAVWSLRM